MLKDVLRSASVFYGLGLTQIKIIIRERVMGGLENCKKSACIWAYRFEVIGIILLILGIILTICYASGLGVAALIVMGGILCLHKHIGKCHCHHNHSDEMDCCPMSSTEEEMGKKSPKVVKNNKVVKKPEA
jgi:hypothetical protein